MSRDLFWLRDESLEDSANLPEPNVLAQEIADDLRAVLARLLRHAAAHEADGVRRTSFATVTSSERAPAR